MGATVIYSTQPTIQGIIREFRTQTHAATPAMGLYFASPQFEASELSRQMQQLFPETPIFGCSSAGEIVSGKMLKHSVVLMLFDHDVIDDVCIEVVENVSGTCRISDVLTRFEAYYGKPISDMDYQHYVGVILIDGLSLAEERVMEKIGDLTNLTFIGGSAGDDLQFQKTYVYANGRAYENAALLALIKPTVGFDVIKTQSFCPMTQTLLATKVNESTREVLEFNHQPALQAYADAIGVSVKHLSESFSRFPVGLMIGDEPYVRSPQTIVADRIRFYCQIKEGMELSLLKSTDIIADTKAAIRSKQAELGRISGMINFHCILRTLELEEKGLTEAYGQLFADIPTIGFSTYGEQYIGHINQTSTILVFQ
ncbi:hypothetical protein U14_01870 [Candidatus Moduliflexus flocculans]|uniref:FIST C-domain domain-containing protein n=1 Tax=Candidatus Moduliflexus flocculans TaxID=1499966 RepID=A0A0S6VT10_9BACT|nr:hypothetical protein U14_01870 [Candidatus Moduliflexus flocculans]